MSHIEDIKRTMDEMLRAFHDIVLDGGEGAASRELEKLRERMPVSVELDPESTAEKDQRTKDVVELAMRTSQIEGHVRTLFERYNESQVVPDDFEDIFLARIDQEDSDGGGEYDQWAEVEADDETGGVKTKTGGRTHTSSSETLWEVNGLTGVPTGTIVTVHVIGGDNLLYVFTAPGGEDGEAPGAMGGVQVYSKWFDITGDEDWHDVDTVHDFANCLIWSVAYYDAGAPLINGCLHQADVQLNNSEFGYAAQGTSPGQTHATSGYTAEILKVLGFVRGDFYLRVGTDGKLEAKVENYTDRFHVRVLLIGSRNLPVTDVVEIS